MQMFRAGGKIAIKSQEPSTQFTTIKLGKLFMKSHYKCYIAFLICEMFLNDAMLKDLMTSRRIVDAVYSVCKSNRILLQDQGPPQRAYTVDVYRYKTIQSI